MPEKLWMGIPQRFTINGIDGLISTNIRNGAVERGVLFQVFHKFDVLAGATYDIAFTTPADKDIRVMPSVISTSGDKVTFQYLEGTTFTGGTTITPHNQNRHSTILPTVTMKGDVTTTVAGTQIAQVWMAGTVGVGQTRSGTQGGGGETHWSVKKGINYILRFINNSSATNTIQLNEIWLEEVQ